MMAAPLVSVIVPSYRAGGYLVELCRSLAAQTYSHFEVLILSDGCEDHLQPELRPYARDPRFRIGAWTSNRGVSAATKHLLGQVRGRFWCYPGADDLLHPGFLAARLEVIDQKPVTNVIFGQGNQIDERGNETWCDPLRILAARLAVFDRQRIDNSRMLRLLLQENVINTPSVFCRSETTIPILVGADIPWRYAQDYHYWLLLAGTVGGFVYDHRVLHSYRMHPRQMSFDPMLNDVRLAELRLVPLVALSDAASAGSGAGNVWRQYRDDLYALWLLRALMLWRRGALRSEWRDRAFRAYCGRTVKGGWWLQATRRLPAAVLLRVAEQRRARRQVWTNGLRKIDDPVFRVGNLQ